MAGLILSADRPARAQVLITNDAAKLVGITVGLAAIGAGIGIGVYVAVHHNHILTGCISNAAGGLQLQNHGDQHTYTIVGEVSALKPGERVRVSGKKSKQKGNDPRQFLVEKLEKNYGACEVEHAER
jgi:hypothetical protein